MKSKGDKENMATRTLSRKTLSVTLILQNILDSEHFLYRSVLKVSILVYLKIGFEMGLVVWDRYGHVMVGSW